MAATEETVFIRIPAQQMILDQFEARSLLNGTTLEEELSAHLKRTADQSFDQHPIYLNDASANDVRRLLGGRVGAPAVLVETIRRMCSWKVGGWKIELSPALQEQVFEYAKASGRPVDQVAPELILTAIREKFRT